jgi:hypothetical protein
MPRVIRPKAPPPLSATRRAARAGWRWLGWGMLGTAVASLVTGAAVVALALQGAPLVAGRTDLAVADVERALAVLRANDPRVAPAGTPRVVEVTPRDLDLLLEHAARRQLGARVRLQLGSGIAEVQASRAVALGPWRRWVNVRAAVREGTPHPTLAGLSVGAVPVPRWVAVRLRAEAEQRLPWAGAIPVVLEGITGVSITPERLRLRYQWRPTSMPRLMAALLPPGELARLRVYHERLGALLDGAPGVPQSLAPVLAGLASTAAARARQWGAPETELRSALLTAAWHATGRPLDALVPATAQWPALPARPLVLAGREDLAKHFLVSALLVLEGTSPLAQVVGVTKEVRDSRPGGSGFSFADLAADLAGTRLGEQAQRDPATLAARLAAGVGEAALLPSLAGLPEGVDSATFQRVYGGVDGAQTARLRGEVTRRVDALALYR